MSDRGIRLARTELVALCNEVEEGSAWAKERRRGFNGFSHLPRSPGKSFQIMLTQFSILKGIFLRDYLLSQSTLSNLISNFLG